MTSSNPENEMWSAEIARLKDVKKKLPMGDLSVLTVIAPPLPGLGSKMFRLAIGGVVFGNVNEAALHVYGQSKSAGEGINFPESCCLCGISPASTVVTVSKDVVSSWAGMLLGGPLLGLHTVQLPVPLCARCATDKAAKGLAPGVEILEYKKSDEVWHLTLRFLNEKLAQKFREINEASIRAQPPPAATAGVSEEDKKYMKQCNACKSWISLAAETCPSCDAKV